MRTTRTLKLSGDLPCKKNRIRVGPRGGRYPKAVKATMTNLEVQVRDQWRDARGPLAPVVHPDFTVKLYVFNPSKDRDGIWTTVLDVLKKGGVIIDDSIRYCNGFEGKAPAQLVDHIRDERIEITITGDLQSAT